MGDSVAFWANTGVLHELQEASGIAGGDDVCAGVVDVVELAFGEFCGHLGLGEVVGAGSAAAPIGLDEVDELEPGDHAENFAGLVADLLAVGEVAGVVVGDFHVEGAGGAAQRQVRQKFANVFGFGDEAGGRFGVSGVVDE